MICELCGNEHDGSYGSGRFCSSKCARSFSTSKNLIEINKKRSDKLRNTKIYSNGQFILHIKDGDDIPDGYVPGNFSMVKNWSFEEFKDAKTGITTFTQLKHKKLNYNKTRRTYSVSKSCLLTKYSDYINNHNQVILTQYKDLLSCKSINKNFEIDSNKLVQYAGYYAIRDDNHTRANAGRVFIHILLAETLLDRHLNGIEIVHHINGNKLDNRFDNIYVFNNKASHARFHYAKAFWLSIDGDVLICDPIDFSKLRLKEISNG